MPKSKLRGGAKAHRKRIQKRNSTIENQQKRIQKLWEQEMMKRIEELNTSGETENNEINEIDDSQPIDIRF
jgi:predicted transcriptional regulator YdeE